MCVDNDIKIAGDKPSQDVRRNRMLSGDNTMASAEEKKKAKAVGKAVAKRFADDAACTDLGNTDNAELRLQRRLLVSFTATVSFERYISDDTLVGFAQKSFLDTLKKLDYSLYRASSDTGAFSFYYLAFRRGNDTERRIGQTFAMLCSHDGDPIFQELGEALYCWFSSEVSKIVSEYF